MSPESKSKQQSQALVLVEIDPSSPVDALDGLLAKGEPKSFTQAEADALCAVRHDGRPVCRVVSGSQGDNGRGAN